MKAVMVVKSAVAACLADGREYAAFRASGSRIGWNSGTGGGIRVSYGFDALPTERDRAGGGIVKLIDLAKHFPHHRSGVNLLYLVSSALPPYAPALARQAKRAGVRVVLNQNGVAYPGWHGPGWELTNRPLGRVLQVADHVFYQSEFCRRSADLFLGTPRGTQEILHNAVDTSVFTPRAAGRAAGGAVTLLLAGSHCQFYRVETALRTLACLRGGGVDARLLIAGRLAWRAGVDDAKRELETAAVELNIDPWVTFLGPYSHAEAVALFQRADILLHTQYNDSCPSLVLEAMACGVPVVYSASGGTPELVGETAGRGVPAPQDWQRVHPPSPAALAEAVVEVAGSLRDCSTAARARAVELFDIRRWAERHRRLFSDLVHAPAEDPGKAEHR